MGACRQGLDDRGRDWWAQIERREIIGADQVDGFHAVIGGRSVMAPPVTVRLEGEVDDVASRLGVDRVIDEQELANCDLESGLFSALLGQGRPQRVSPQLTPPPGSKW